VFTSSAVIVRAQQAVVSEVTTVIVLARLATAVFDVMMSNQSSNRNVV